MGISVQGSIGGVGEKPVTILTGFGFNSLAIINGISMGANSAGLHLLNSGNKDGLSTFEKSFTLATTDFNDRHPKRGRFIYIGFSADSSLVITVTIDDKSTVDVMVKPNTNGLQRIRVPVPRSIQGRYFTVKISSSSQFVVDNIEILPIVRSSGIGGY